ncbi:MAG TPA: YihY/virulence factor BrkB family protein [Solirubrobacteraceae bacterium]|jgi:membrane protein|nr:YihY/virulence factor BrkB family protein [Solirubrobacteraceae bacterium]
MTSAADTAENGRKRSGRRPEGPAHARKGSLFQTLKRTLTEFSEDNLTDWAAALTYYGVLSMFPALIALVSIVGLVFDPQEIIRTLTDIVGQLGPTTAIDTFRGPIEQVASSQSTAGIALIFGVVVALWSGSGYVGAFMRASNVIYEVEEGRPIWKLRPLQMAVTLIMILLLAIAAISVIVTGPLASAVGSAIGLGDTAVTVWNIAKWPVLVVLVALMIASLYYSSPNAKLGGFKRVLPGALFAVVIWAIASALFAFYAANFGSYNKTYGTLGGVVGFLVWLWITNVAILLGAELNAERERTRQLAEGVPEAERELQLEERSEPKESKRSRTA